MSLPQKFRPQWRKPPSAQLELSGLASFPSSYRAVVAKMYHCRKLLQLLFPTFFAGAFVAVGWIAVPPAIASAEEFSANRTAASGVQTWVNQLADDSFHAREQAQRRLVESHDTARVTAALHAVKDHPLLEVRAAARRLLDEIALREFDANLARLNSGIAKTETVDLPGWKHFSSIAGDDVHSRKLFSRIALRHYDLLELIDEWCQQQSVRNLTLSSARHPSRSSDAVLAFLDPYQLSTGDTNLWALLFCIDSPGVNHGMPNLSTRVCSVLSHSALGPKVVAKRGAGSTGDALVLHRMVDHWLASHPNVGTSRDRLLIAMRYQCTKHANAICDSTLNDTMGSPAEHVTAMLCAAVLQRQDLEVQLLARMNDARTAHVWQLIASRKTKIRTEVRDVALALLLHHRGIDPRQVGFEELQADPLLVFRDHSLGFSDDVSRTKAYDASNVALGNTVANSN